MGKYSKKADALFTEMTNRVAEIVKVKGSNAGGFRAVKAIALGKESIENPLYDDCEIEYIGETLMYDKYGRSYAFMDLGIDTLAELVDTLEVL